jgi:hypothetical protein
MSMIAIGTAERIGGPRLADCPVLYCAADLVFADYLAHEFRRKKSVLKIDVQHPEPKAVLNRLTAGVYRAILVDSNLPLEERLLLIRIVQQRDPEICIVAMIPNGREYGSNQILEAGADARITRSHTLVRELPSVIEDALKRRLAGVKQENNAPKDSTNCAPLKEVSGPGNQASVAIPLGTVPETSQGGADKRAVPRWQVHILCKISFQGQTVRGTMHDFSAGGAFLETAEIPAVGTKVVITTRSPTPMRLTGTVAHHGWFLEATRNFEGFGISFHNLTAEDQKTVLDICERQSQPAQKKVQLEH